MTHDKRKTIEELLSMEPDKMLSDPRILTLNESELEALFYTLAPKRERLHEADERSSKVFELLDQVGFKWHGEDQPARLLDLKERVARGEVSADKYDEELLYTYAYLAALSDKYE